MKILLGSILLYGYGLFAFWLGWRCGTVGDCYPEAEDDPDQLAFEWSEWANFQGPRPAA